MAELKKLLYVEDLVELRELNAFLIKCHFDCEIVEAGNVTEAKAILAQDRSFDLVISDYNMPNGTGGDLYRFLREKHFYIPFIILSANTMTASAGFGPEVRCLEKPIDPLELMKAVEDVMGDNKIPASNTYIPVPISLLKKMKVFNNPIFVKLNDEKYVKVFNENAVITDEDYAKYQARGITYLYLEKQTISHFIRDYQKDVISSETWAELKTEDFESSFKLNTELLRNTGLPMIPEMLEMTKSHIQVALKILAKDKKLDQVIQRFHKIEGLGYSDHCMLLVHVCGFIIAKINPSGLTHNLPILTMAALIHDSSLSDRIYDQKAKGAFIGLVAHMKNPSSDEKEMINHSLKAAQQCKGFDFCHEEVATVIAQHHERPDGGGYPGRLTGDKINPLAALFIVAEDFVDYFLKHYPRPDWKTYAKSRRPIYNAQAFLDAFSVLEKSFPV